MSADVALTADRVQAWRERMETKAREVAREVGFSNSPPRGRAFVRHFDATRREWYEEAVYTWARGTVRVDSRTMETEIKRTP